MIKAVLFDFDGVLVNSTPYHYESWKRIFKPYGIEVDPKEIYRSEGAKALDTARQIAHRGGLSLSEKDLKELVERKRKIYRSITRADIQEGAKSLIKKIKKKNLKLGLVSGSVMKNIKRVLDDEFLDNFDVVITGDDVAKGKPDPECYLKAAEKLGLPPHECLVVENAPLGIQAAKRANMTCIAITTTLRKEDLQGADFILKNLVELAERTDDLANWPKAKDTPVS